jgi:hypothetical protein
VRKFESTNNHHQKMNSNKAKDDAFLVGESYIFRIPKNTRPKHTQSPMPTTKYSSILSERIEHYNFEFVLFNAQALYILQLLYSSS